MRAFSERIGLAKPKSGIQIESVDEALRNGLWNALSEHFLSQVGHDPLDGRAYASDELRLTVKSLWQYYFKRALDTLPRDWGKVYAELRKYFYQCAWNEVYDFIEFFAFAWPNAYAADEFRKAANSVLQLELSAYRFVDAHVARVTDQPEIDAIEEGLSMRGSLSSVTEHLAAALRLMSDRRQPDYRNSIKESISAVEAICALVVGQSRSDLNAALRALEGRAGMHAALRSAFNSLYGFTSDSNGIRHALLEEPNLTFDDAKFMLVACSAFVNYVKAKASQSGITMKPVAS